MTRPEGSRRDVDVVIALIRERLPEVAVEQLQVKFPADDDGLWFFRLPGRGVEVQIESSTGECPFLVENDANADCLDCTSVAGTVEAAIAPLGGEAGCPPTRSEP